MGLLVLLSIVNGLSESRIHLLHASGLEFVFGIGKFIVTILGSIALYRVIRHPLRAWQFLCAWAVPVSLLAGAAPMVFGHAPAARGVASATGAAILLGLTLWLWHRNLRVPDRPGCPSQPNRRDAESRHGN